MRTPLTKVEKDSLQSGSLVSLRQQNAVGRPRRSQELGMGKMHFITDFTVTVWDRMGLVTEAAFWSPRYFPGSLTLHSRLLTAVIRKGLPWAGVFTYKKYLQGSILQDFKKILEK